MNYYYVNFENVHKHLWTNIVKKFLLIRISKLIMKYELRVNLVFIILLSVRF